MFKGVKMDKRIVYFVCVWDSFPRAWLSIKPYKGTELGQVQWRGQPITVKIIAGDTVEMHRGVEKPPPDLYALLKSNLQKQVRRGKIGAVATANRMWELGQFELLRRLVVIAAEDAEVSTETAVVSWLMAAKSKGLVLTKKHRKWILGYVQAMVESPVCRRLEIRDKWTDHCSDLTLMDILDSFHNNNEQIAGILFRNAYGGLNGDPPMISRCIDWLLQTDTSLPTLQVKPYDGELPKLLINPATIDHHISQDLVYQLTKEHKVDEDLLCSTIWECSSGVNCRKKQIIDPKYRECWELVHGDFKEYGRRHLLRILKKYNGL